MFLYTSFSLDSVDPFLGVLLLNDNFFLSTFCNTSIQFEILLSKTVSLGRPRFALSNRSTKTAPSDVYL